jgi:eukaryotic-like serine/threonine-protein kinase
VNDLSTVAGASLSSLVAQAADEFLDQLDRGKQPDLESFAERYPQIAGVLRQILPVLCMFQEVETRSTGPLAALEETRILGDFRIVRELGRGGMGIVYEAEQISLSRMVALKVLPVNSGLGPKPLARFQIEAQVAALLNHPHIVPIFAVGCDQGIHYYAMRLIEGRSLAELLRERGNQRGRGGRFPPREAASLAIQAAEALEVAHGAGILHRDIKPGNLLLDQRGHLWVTDFGLARLQGVSDLTLTGELLGTLRYMSPEQAAGGRILDARTDVYALGATLYELLTGMPAFDAADREDLLGRISAVAPVPPRRHDATIPPDLEMIVLKAISKEPDHRYTTASELAKDLGRFLAGQPILARRPSLVDRGSRWSRRHQRIVLSAAALLVLAALALASGMAILWNEQKRTQAALATAQEARRREREALRFTFAASDQIADRALAIVASNVVPAGQDQEFCRKALDYYLEISDRYRDDPEMRRITAAALHRIGFIRMILHEDGSESAYHQSLALYEGLLTESAFEPGLGEDIALAYSDLALLFSKTHQAPEELDCLRRVVSLQQRLAMDYPAATHYLISLVYRQAQLLDLLVAAGQAQEADDVRRQFGKNYILAANHRPSDPKARNNLAWLMVSRPLVDAQAASQAVELAKEAVTLAPEEGAYWNTLGVAYYRVKAWTAAAGALERSMRLRSGGDAYDWFCLAMVCHRQDRKEEALQWYDRAAAWTKANPSASRNELQRFQAEAVRLLNLEKTSSRQTSHSDK